MAKIEDKDLATISFNEEIKGWTSFHSFFPDWMIGMNNQFYTFSNGELFRHHDTSADRNTYYGQSFPSKISIMVNTSPSEIKEIQAVSLEGNTPWDLIIKGFISNDDDFTQSSIDDLEFVQKEGIWYAYVRRNENPNQLDSKSVYGIGTVLDISGNNLVVDGFSDFITAGDKIINENLDVVGVVTDTSFEQGLTFISLDAITNLNQFDFIMGSKDARIEGGNLRGYTLRMDLTVNKPTKVELFAVNTEVMKSFP